MCFQSINQKTLGNVNVILPSDKKKSGDMESGNRARGVGFLQTSPSDHLRTRSMIEVGKAVGMSNLASKLGQISPNWDKAGTF